MGTPSLRYCGIVAGYSGASGMPSQSASGASSQSDVHLSDRLESCSLDKHVQSRTYEYRANTLQAKARQRLCILMKIHARRDSPTFLGAIVAFVHFPKLKLRAQAEGDYRKM